MRLFILSRHAESTLNREQRVNGDPSVPAPLTERGREEARFLGLELRSISLDSCVHTRFARTRETAELALEAFERPVKMREEPLLDDIKVGELEGGTLDEYRAWKQLHTRADRFPGGESLDECALRYARGFRALLEAGANTVLVVCHEIPVRYALNAAACSEELDGPLGDIPNATPFLFADDALERAAERIEQLAAGRR